MDHKSRRKTKLLLGVGIFILLASVSVAYSIVKLNQPVEGTIIQHPIKSSTNSAPVKKQIKTTYYSASYPSRYDILPAPSSTASLDAQVLVAHQQARYGTGSRISLTLAALPAGGVKEDSAYKLYASQPGIYSLSDGQFGSDPVIIATRSSPNYEKIILRPHDTYLLTATLSADSQSSEVDADMAQIMNSIRW